MYPSVVARLIICSVALTLVLGILSIAMLLHTVLWTKGYIPTLALNPCTKEGTLTSAVCRECGLQTAIHPYIPSSYTISLGNRQTVECCVCGPVGIV